MFRNLDRTTLIGSLSLALITPIIAAAATDPQFTRWALILNGLVTGLNAVGNILSRDKRMSDQQANARLYDPESGHFVDAIDFSAKGGDGR